MQASGQRGDSNLGPPDYEFAPLTTRPRRPPVKEIQKKETRSSDLKIKKKDIQVNCVINVSRIFPLRTFVSPDLP